MKKRNIKKIAGALIVVLLVIAGYFCVASGIIIRKTQPPPSQQATQRATVSVFITGIPDSVTVSGIQAATAYDALVAVANEKHLLVQTKTYSFGIFVEQIGDYPNTKDKAWIYYVNGKSGTVAADKQNLKTGDTVEWKYEKPAY